MNRKRTCPVNERAEYTASGRILAFLVGDWRAISEAQSESRTRSEDVCRVRTMHVIDTRDRCRFKSYLSCLRVKIERP